MNREELREIVAEQVRRALRGETPATAEPGPDPGRPTVVAAFGAGQTGLATALSQLRELAERLNIVALLSEGAQEILGAERLKKESGAREVVLSDGAASPREIAHRAAAVVVAQLTHTTLARLALGLGDTLLTNVVLHALRCGKPVVIARDGADPSLAGCDQCAGGANAPRELHLLYDEYLARLTAFGCRVVPAGLLAEETFAALADDQPRRARQTGARRVVTEEDVVRASRRSESLDVRGAIVTALARDTARDLGVPLIEA